MIKSLSIVLKVLKVKVHLDVCKLENYHYVFGN